MSSIPHRRSGLDLVRCSNERYVRSSVSLQINEKRRRMVKQVVESSILNELQEMEDEIERSYKTVYFTEGKDATGFGQKPSTSLPAPRSPRQPRQQRQQRQLRPQRETALMREDRSGSLSLFKELSTKIDNMSRCITPEWADRETQSWDGDVIGGTCSCNSGNGVLPMTFLGEEAKRQIQQRYAAVGWERERMGKEDELSASLWIKRNEEAERERKVFNDDELEQLFLKGVAGSKKIATWQREEQEAKTCLMLQRLGLDTTDIVGMAPQGARGVGQGVVWGCGTGPLNAPARRLLVGSGSVPSGRCCPVVLGGQAQLIQVHDDRDEEYQSFLLDEKQSLLSKITKAKANLVQLRGESARLQSLSRSVMALVQRRDESARRLASAALTNEEEGKALLGKIKSDVSARELELSQGITATTMERRGVIEAMKVESAKLAVKVRKAKKWFAKKGYAVATSPHTPAPVVESLVPDLMRKEEERVIQAEVGEVLASVVDRAIQRALLKNRKE